MGVHTSAELGLAPSSDGALRCPPACEMPSEADHTFLFNPDGEKAECLRRSANSLAYGSYPLSCQLKTILSQLAASRQQGARIVLGYLYGLWALLARGCGGVLGGRELAVETRGGIRHCFRHGRVSRIHAARHVCAVALHPTFKISSLGIYREVFRTWRGVGGLVALTWGAG